MATKGIYQLLFEGVQIVEVEFKTMDGEFLKDSPVQFKIRPTVLHDKDDKTIFTLIMNASIISENIFTLKFIAIGNFRFEEEDLNPDVRKKLVDFSAPAIMFPYIRSFVTTFTAAIGSLPKPLVIPPQFFQTEIPEVFEGDPESFGS